MVNDQSCGECQACCEAIGVHELNKPIYTLCQNQCVSGCGIYEQRPNSCRSYYCLWQAGFMDGDINMRPDKLGIILDFRTGKAGDTAKAILTKWAEKFIIIIRRYKSNRRRLIGPGNKMAQIQKLVEIG